MTDSNWWDALKKKKKMVWVNINKKNWIVKVKQVNLNESNNHGWNEFVSALKKTSIIFIEIAEMF